jgi:sulfite reductase (NADPH) flavoprotein alpha-component
MNQPVFPPAITLIPETAPFTVEQRTWLNGFLAGYISLDGSGVTALSPDQSAALMPAAPQGDGDDGEAPWHDQTMPLDERMNLAAGRPLRRRMMAAMAQQDCGQCGYNCSDYSEKLANGEEARLNLCVPGGKETLRMLKTLAVEIGSSPQPSQPSPAAAKAPTTTPTAAATVAPTSGSVSPNPLMAGTSREAPAEAVFRARTKLTQPGSEKDTYHIEIDLAESGIDYAVGDAFGLYPRNDPALVSAVIAELGAQPDFEINGRTLRQVLTDGVSLSLAPDVLFQLFSYITGGDRRQKAKLLADGGDPDGDAATLDVLAALQKFKGARVDPEAFIESLDPLQPRLYSISSSLKTSPNAVTLTVDTVRYEIEKRQRLGVASTFLAERINPGDKIKAYVQKAGHFNLPEDPTTPIIMIGPGTGVAPFRAFLHDRMASGATGKNWLFYGHRRRDTDFFYEDEFVDMKAKNVLTRLSLAWSRDTQEKFYVQDRMRQVGRDLWAWLSEGAHIYVCGDAKRMAKDVERTLVDIVAQHGVRSLEEAIAFVGNLKKQHRYHQDVY